MAFAIHRKGQGFCPLSPRSVTVILLGQSVQCQKLNCAHLRIRAKAKRVTNEVRSTESPDETDAVQLLPIVPNR